MKSSAIRRCIFDFDGTCTQIPLAYKQYLEEYRRIFSSEVEQVDESGWNAAQEAVISHCPEAGWMVAGTPSAPANGDPYILASEVSRFIVADRKITKPLPPDIHSRAYAAFPAPWRADAYDLFCSLIDHNIDICIISNSSTTVIEGRVDELLGADTEQRKKVAIKGDAAKFRIQELNWMNDNLTPAARDLFQSLPSSDPASDLKRPIYLLRGAYFEAIVQAVKGDLESLRDTIFCGDIWELDLAMPSLVGANVHLIKRDAPFATHAYELDAVQRSKTCATVSENLRELKAHILS